MSKQKGIIKIKGTLNGLCYYKLNGEYIVRKATGPSKERINNDPAFTQVKGNNQEFAAAVYLSKAIITGLGPVSKIFKDSYMQSRLTGVCRKIVQQGSGISGQREANLLNNPEGLVGFQLDKEKPFNQIITAIPQVSINTERNTVTIAIQNNACDKLIKHAKKGKQFSYTAVVGAVSSFTWNISLEMYQPECPEQNGLGAVINSSIAPNKKLQDFQIDINTNENINSNVALTVWLGLSSVETIHDKLAQSYYGMQCIAVL